MTKLKLTLCLTMILLPQHAIEKLISGFTRNIQRDHPVVINNLIESWYLKIHQSIFAIKSWPSLWKTFRIRTKDIHDALQELYFNPLSVADTLSGYGSVFLVKSVSFVTPFVVEFPDGQLSFTSITLNSFYCQSVFADESETINITCSLSFKAERNPQTGTIQNQEKWLLPVDSMTSFDQFRSAENNTTTLRTRLPFEIDIKWFKYEVASMCCDYQATHNETHQTTHGTFQSSIKNLLVKTKKLAQKSDWLDIKIRLVNAIHHNKYD